MTITATYSGSPLLTLRPDWQGPSESFVTTSAKTRLDNAVSAFTDDSITPGGVGQRGVRFVLDGRQCAADWRVFFDGQRGRGRLFWMPTWVDDLELVQSQIANQNILKFKLCGFTRFYAISDFGRRHVVVILPGSPEILLPRRVTASVDNGDGTETITLDAQFGVDVPITAGISLLSACRFNEDRVDMHWLNFDLVQVETTVRELPREAPTT